MRQTIHYLQVATITPIYFPTSSMTYPATFLLVSYTLLTTTYSLATLRKRLSTVPPPTPQDNYIFKCPCLSVTNQLPIVTIPQCIECTFFAPPPFTLSLTTGLSKPSKNLISYSDLCSCLFRTQGFQAWKSCKRDLYPLNLLSEFIENTALIIIKKMRVDYHHTTLWRNIFF